MRLASLLLAFLISSLLFGETLTDKVVQAAGGDMLTILKGSEQIKIRLGRIDALERGQP